MSYSTLLEVCSQALKALELPFQTSKIKLNDKYVELADLKLRLSTFTSSHKVCMEVYATSDCEWFDKAQLFDGEGGFKAEVADCLRELYEKFSRGEGRMYPADIAEVFGSATGQDNISAQDSRVCEIMNVHSNNGQFLTLEEWVGFYYQSALKHAPVVVSNLANLGYRTLFDSSSTFEQMLSINSSLRQ
jgi:hypothetical protein